MPHMYVNVSCCMHVDLKLNLRNNALPLGVRVSSIDNNNNNKWQMVSTIDRADSVHDM